MKATHSILIQLYKIIFHTTDFISEYMYCFIPNAPLSFHHPWDNYFWSFIRCFVWSCFMKTNKVILFVTFCLAYTRLHHLILPANEISSVNSNNVTRTPPPAHSRTVQWQPQRQTQPVGSLRRWRWGIIRELGGWLSKERWEGQRIGGGG